MSELKECVKDQYRRFRSISHALLDQLCNLARLVDSILLERISRPYVADEVNTPLERCCSSAAQRDGNIRTHWSVGF